MTDAVRIPDDRGIPDAAIIMRIIGGLDNQFRFTVQRKREERVPNQRRIIFRSDIPRSAETDAVYENACGAERFLQIERGRAVSL